MLIALVIVPPSILTGQFSSSLPYFTFAQKVLLENNPEAIRIMLAKECALFIGPWEPGNDSTVIVYGAPKVSKLIEERLSTLNTPNSISMFQRITCFAKQKLGGAVITKTTWSFVSLTDSTIVGETILWSENGGRIESMSWVASPGPDFLLDSQNILLPRVDFFSQHDDKNPSDIVLEPHATVANDSPMAAEKMKRLVGNAHHEFHNSLMKMWPALVLPVLRHEINPLRNFLHDKSPGYALSTSLKFSVSSAPSMPSRAATSSVDEEAKRALVISEVDIYQSLCAVSGKISKLDSIFVRCISTAPTLHNVSLHSVLLESRSTYLCMRQSKTVEPRPLPPSDMLCNSKKGLAICASLLRAGCNDCFCYLLRLRQFIYSTTTIETDKCQLLQLFLLVASQFRHDKFIV
jgi:hypothetical protein